MATIQLRKPKSFTEFVEIVQQSQATCNDPLWYRGCGKASHQLIPGLYRHERIKKIVELAKLELQLMTRFRQRSIPFHDRQLSEDWDLLFFMQHYRIPTRLLDWTENPFIGLYFSIMSSKFTVNKTGKLTFADDTAVWILNPVAWNRHALSHQSFNGEVLDPTDDALKGYRPAQSFTAMNNYPVAIFGTHNSPRIVAQRGVFTIFGQNVKPMEELFTSGSFPRDCLVKVVLASNVLEKIRISILNHGITESVVFPDLDGLAQEVRRSFGFEV